MSRKYKFHNQEKPYFVSFATVNWIDVFTRRIYKDILIDSINYCIENKGLIVYGWCIMTNHLHLIIGTKNNPMQDILRDLKGFTSKTILKAIEENPQESRKEWMLWMFKRAGLKNSNNKNYQFWQQNNQPIELETNEMFDQKLDYIHKNPVEEGYVEKEEHYIYSSAIDYLGEKGFIEMEIVL